MHILLILYNYFIQEDISGELLQIFKEICGSKETLKGIPPPKDLQDIPQVRQAISK